MGLTRPSPLLSVLEGSRMCEHALLASTLSMPQSQEESEQLPLERVGEGGIPGAFTP